MSETNDRHLSTDHLLVDLKGRTISGGFVTMLAQGIQFVLTLVSTMVLARLLSPADFGILAMVLTVVGFLRIFKDAGLSTATIQRVTITHAQVSNLFWINVILGGTITLIVAACSPLIAWFYHEPRLVNVTLLLSLTFILTGLSVQHMALLNRQMRFKAIAVIQILSQVISVLVGLGMAWTGFGYWSLAWTQLSLPIVTLLLVWCISRWRPQLPTSHSGIRPMLGFGANLTASGVIASFAGGADTLLIGRYYGLVPVGLYSRAGALLRRPMEQLISPITAVFVPVLSRLESQPERYRRTFVQIYEATAIVSALFTGLLLALSRPITLVLLGEKWEKVAIIFAGFTVSSLFTPLMTMCCWLLESQGRGKDFLRITLVLSSVSTASFFAGLPFGPAGVAIAYSASCMLIQLPVIYYTVGGSGPVTSSDLWTGFLRCLPIWGIVFGSAFLTSALIPARSPFVQLLIGVPTGLLGGFIYIWSNAHARRTALNLVDILRSLKSAKPSLT